MIDVQKAQQAIEAHLADLPLPKQPAALYLPASYILSIGGKRIRPLAVLLAHSLFDDHWQKALPAATAIEIFHNFTLVHDDIMDKASLRRGHETVHVKWDVNTAILSGDVMQVLAYKQLLLTQTANLFNLLDTFTDISKGVCEGQQFDMDYESRTDVSMEEYLHMIGLKTATLLAGSLKIGAITAGADEKACQTLFRYGFNLGLSFQIMDDILDSFGDGGKVGKKIGGDILARKQTCLMVFARNAGTHHADALNEIYASETDDASIIERIKSIFSESGALAAAKELAHSYAAKADYELRTLDAVRVRKEQLSEFFNALLHRES